METVEYYFNREKISIAFLERHFDGDYWDKCVKFIQQQWNVPVQSLTPKQEAWFDRILEDAIEKRIEG